MKKVFLLTILCILLLSVIIVGFKNDVIATTPQLPPVNETVERYKANENTALVSVDVFIQKTNVAYKRQNAKPRKKVKVLYQDVESVYPAIGRNKVHYISPKRQVYLLVSQFDTFESPRFGTLENIEFYEMYDAETGENIVLGFSMIQ